MTPAERADLINRQEFHAECRAARERALHNAEACRKAAAARLAEWIVRELPPSLITHPRPGRQPKVYTHNGQSKSLTEWAVITGVSLSTLTRRIRSGMDFGTAISMEPYSHARQHAVNGASKTLRQWADHIGITNDALIKRMSAGRTLAEALAMPSGRGRRRGVSRDLGASKGTSAGSTAQEQPEITFSKKAESA